MVTVKKAYHKHGYSGLDHLLDDYQLEPVVGQRFPSVTAARSAAEKLSSGTSGNGCNVPIGLVVIHGNGNETRH